MRTDSFSDTAKPSQEQRACHLFCTQLSALPSVTILRWPLQSSSSDNQQHAGRPWAPKCHHPEIALDHADGTSFDTTTGDASVFMEHTVRERIYS